MLSSDSKKAIKKIIIYFTLTAFMIAIITYLSTTDAFGNAISLLSGSEDYVKNTGPLQICPVIEKASLNDSTTVLVTGDSVCNQMFSNADLLPNVRLLATNAAIGSSGQYLIAKEYLEAHPNATDIFLIMQPFSLRQSVEKPLGYQYTIMPFALTGLLYELDEETLATYTSTYGQFFLRKNTVETINKSSLLRKIYLNSLKQIQSSPDEIYFKTSDACINQLLDLCNEKDVSLYLISCPMSEFHRTDMELVSKEYSETWMFSVFPDYMNNIVYFPEEYSEDGSHFAGEYANQELYNTMIYSILDEESVNKIILQKN